MNKYFKELILWILIAIPFIYLAIVWKELPAQVATHFDLQGNPNDWTAKTSMPFLIGALGIGTYLLMLFIPFFDPKNKIQQMGDKYYSLRLLMTLLMSVISFYLLYVGSKGEINPNLLIGLIGGFDAVFGNYLQTVKPNYFIGIRTPWALENDQTWKKTHRLAGRIWMGGGLLIVSVSIFSRNNYALGILFAIITFIIVIIPIVYSYTEFKKIHKNEN
jgi:uncharacterized membrane protein